MFKLLPSFVGSKAFWVDKLKRYEGRTFVELFAGSAVLSHNKKKDMGMQQGMGM